MNYLSPEQKEQVRRECEGLAGRERTQKVRELSMQHHVHPSTIYRALPADERRRRADRGRRRCRVPREVLEKMLALSLRELSAAEVIELAELNGWLEPGAISEPTYNRWLGQYHLSRRQRRTWIRPYVRFEESFSNERHYLDITGFPDYFVEPDGSIGYESTLQRSKNRPGNRKPRLQLFWIVDGYSRVQYGSFYLGKNTLNWIDFLLRAWGPKDDPYHFPFQGRPHYLYSDMESIFFTPPMVRFLRAMDVRYHHHEPGNARAKGKVERPIGVVQTWLRHAFSLMNRPTLEQANRYVADLLYKINGRTHAGTRQEPLQRWRAGFPTRATIRLMPDEHIVERFFYTQAQRVIQGDLTIQLHGRRWQLPRKTPFTNFTGQSVSVFYHPGVLEIKSIFVVLDEVEYEIEHALPVPQAAGEYRRIAPSDQEKLIQQLEQVDLSDLEVGGYKERYARRSFLPAAGEALDVEALHLPRRALSRIQLIQQLQALEALSTPPTAAEKAYLDHLYAGGAEVYEDELDHILDELRPGGRQAAAL